MGLEDDDGRGGKCSILMDPGGGGGKDGRIVQISSPGGYEGERPSSNTSESWSDNNARYNRPTT